MYISYFIRSMSIRQVTRKFRNAVINVAKEVEVYTSRISHDELLNLCAVHAPSDISTLYI